MWPTGCPETSVTKYQTTPCNVTLSDLVPFTFDIHFVLYKLKRTRRRSCLSHCTTSRKIAGSIPDSVIGNFHWRNPVALGSTQPLTDMSIRNISWGVKVAGVKYWQTFHLNVPIVLKSGSLDLLEPSGSLQACSGIVLPLFINYRQRN